MKALLGPDSAAGSDPTLPLSVNIVRMASGDPEFLPPDWHGEKLPRASNSELCGMDGDRGFDRRSPSNCVCADREEVECNLTVSAEEKRKKKRKDKKLTWKGKVAETEKEEGENGLYDFAHLDLSAIEIPKNMDLEPTTVQRITHLVLETMDTSNNEYLDPTAIGQLNNTTMTSQESY